MRTETELRQPLQDVTTEIPLREEMFTDYFLVPPRIRGYYDRQSQELKVSLEDMEAVGALVGIDVVADLDRILKAPREQQPQLLQQKKQRMISRMEQDEKEERRTGQSRIYSYAGLPVTIPTFTQEKIMGFIQSISEGEQNVRYLQNYWIMDTLRQKESS